MGLGNSSGTTLPPHHGHHAHHPQSYLLNGHDKEFKGLNAFEKYKSSSPYGKNDSDDDDERVDIMDDEDDAMTSSSVNGHVSNSQGSGETNDFHHKLFGFETSKQTSADSKGKPGTHTGHVSVRLNCPVMSTALASVIPYQQGRD